MGQPTEQAGTDDAFAPACAAFGRSLPPELQRPFALIAFDWDGTAVTSRRADAAPVRAVIDQLLRLGVFVFVVTGTNFDNIDRQLSAPLSGPQKRRLFISTNRGSEVYGFDDASRPVLLWQRVATPEEDQRLTACATAIQSALAARTGLPIEVIANRMNRRKVDLIPLPAWADPPKSAIGELLQAVEGRLRGAGLRGGLAEAFALAEGIVRERGPEDARITSDVKHLEIGLTDKSDAIAWMMREIAQTHAIHPSAILIGGDEFGTIGGLAGSDMKMVLPETRGAAIVSVGAEPGGVPPGVVHLGGGPARFLMLLACQVALHQRQRAATPTDGTVASATSGTFPVAPTSDPRWVITEEGFTVAREHEVESLFTVANGYAGVRGSLAEGSVLSSPATYIAGVFARPPQSDGIPRLAIAPDWTRLRVTVDGQELRLERGVILEHRRILDLRQGMLWREWRHQDPSGRITRLRSLRLAALADRHMLVQMTAVTPENYSGHLALECPQLAPLPDGSVAADGVATAVSPAPDATVAEVPVAGTDQMIAMAGLSQLHTRAPETAVRRTEEERDLRWVRWAWDAPIGSTCRLDQVVAVAASREGTPPAAAALEHLRRALADGAAALVHRHVQAWALRWQAADLVVEGDEDAQMALRFAAYHLISAASPEDGRVSVGARGLTGEIYQGHIFWDTEIFMLPFYLFTDPPSARALLMYRYHTLDAARRKARALGFAGALFAWESADTGDEVTPPFAVLPDGVVIPIRCGELEHHISAAIAFAVWQYWQVTGDDRFFLDAGAELVLETARFWASRCQLGPDGQYHLHRVIGPDEYHEAVSDDAYTNVMAQWNLERGAEAARILQDRWPQRWQELSRRLDLTAAEAQSWGPLAQAIAIRSKPEDGLLEQFTGYFDLDPAPIARAGPQTVEAGLALGSEQLRTTQVIKQADVVMLLALLPERFPPSVAARNFDYYEARTAHGSSLSPAIHALVAARLGRRELAESYFREAAAIDLNNALGNAAGGVHLGALGGLWQAAVFGFAGVSVRAGTLLIDPRLPDGWQCVRFRVRVRGQQADLRLTQEPPTVEVRLADGEGLRVGLADGPAVTVRSGRRYTAARAGATWGGWQEEAIP